MRNPSLLLLLCDAWWRVPACISGDLLSNQGKPEVVASMIGTSSRAGGQSSFLVASPHRHAAVTLAAVERAGREIGAQETGASNWTKGSGGRRRCSAAGIGTTRVHVVAMSEIARPNGEGRRPLPVYGPFRRTLRLQRNGPAITDYAVASSAALAIAGPVSRVRRHRGDGSVTVRA